jgi:hypothetical protein
MKCGSIICADWGAQPKKRKAWVADIAKKQIRPLELVDLSIETLVEAAKRAPKPVVIAIDAVLGIPRSYLDRWKREVDPEHKDFLSWLKCANEIPGFYEEVGSASDWSVQRPFIKVPGGKGSLSQFWLKSNESRPLLRNVERQSKANSVLIVSGIPGSVGSGSRALWKELAPLLAKTRTERGFGVWPFEGGLATLLGSDGVVLAEMYPRVCYGLALDDALPAALRKLAKTKEKERVRQMESLRRTDWLKKFRVQLDEHHAATAEGDEDLFDAALAAAGFLRCILEGRCLERDCGLDEVEGDILGIAAIDFSKRSQNVATGGVTPSRLTKRPARVRAGARASTTTAGQRCPLCDRQFRAGRIGWDAHVASLRTHPKWRPDVTDASERKEIFRREHADWFEEPRTASGQQLTGTR